MLHGFRWGEIYIRLIYAFVGSKILFMFVPRILNREYVFMCVVMSYEAPLPQYLNCRTVSGSELFEGIPLGGTPFVFLVIMVLCIAISCVLRKMHSPIHLKIFAVWDTCCIWYYKIGLLRFSCPVKFLAKFGKYRRNCASGQGNVDIGGETF
jgi:hypothetical protein